MSKVIFSPDFFLSHRQIVNTILFELRINNRFKKLHIVSICWLGFWLFFGFFIALACIV